ncbi:MAG: hypothetical protein Q4G22_14525 [Paracoccus sp. (in: a-proteobacteria)]|uniref:hypothetical protein n=1 Tax=Paracoccus sp. TaxID=267 RepID=UPI0026DF3753|nr:hypothetical protein [Paracoccus sp. (in: a-proteobacteria)]MDO5633029.1 hypothetical protein [Paracoccus sp. (in: a-proteobacteria)]
MSEAVISDALRKAAASGGIFGARLVILHLPGRQTAGGHIGILGQVAVLIGTVFVWLWRPNCNARQRIALPPKGLLPVPIRLILCGIILRAPNLRWIDIRSIPNVRRFVAQIEATRQTAAEATA